MRGFSWRRWQTTSQILLPQTTGSSNEDICNTVLLLAQGVQHTEVFSLPRSNEGLVWCPASGSLCTLVEVEFPVKLQNSYKSQSR